VIFPNYYYICMYIYILNCKKKGLNLTFAIPNCLKYRNKGKDYNSQTQQYFMVFLKYIITIWATCFGFYQVILRPSRCRSRHTNVLLHCGIPKVYRIKSTHYIYTYIYIYTGCNRRNGPDFGRVFLMLNYTENPQNTYIQS